MIPMDKAVFFKKNEQFPSTIYSNFDNQIISGVDLDFMSLFHRYIEELDVKSDHTINSYRFGLKKLFTYFETNGISRPDKQDIIKWKKQMLDEGSAPATVNSYLMSSRMFFKYLEEYGIYQNIFKNIKNVKVGLEHKRDPLNVEQVNRFLSSIDTDTLIGKRDFALIHLLVTTGLRIGEVANANVKDLSEKMGHKVLYITGKGHYEDKQDFVKLPDGVFESVRDYLVERNNQETLEEEQPLFQSTTVRTPEKRFKYNSLSRLISNLMKKAEIKSPRITAHSLRHTTATLNIINGGTLEETRDLLRHESFETTKRYLHHVDAITNQSSNRVNDLLDIKSK